MKLESVQTVPAPPADPGVPAKVNDDRNGEGSPFAAMVRDLSKEEPAALRQFRDRGGENHARPAGTPHREPRSAERSSPPDKQKGVTEGPSRDFASIGQERGLACKESGEGPCEDGAPRPETPAEDRLPMVGGVVLPASAVSAVDVAADAGDELSQSLTAPASATQIEGRSASLSASSVFSATAACQDPVSSPAVASATQLALPSVETAKVSVPPSPAPSSDGPLPGLTMTGAAPAQEPAVQPLVSDTTPVREAGQDAGFEVVVAKRVPVLSSGSISEAERVRQSAATHCQFSGDERPEGLAQERSAQAERLLSATPRAGVSSGLVTTLGTLGRQDGPAERGLADRSSRDRPSQIVSSRSSVQTDAAGVLAENAATPDVRVATPCEPVAAAETPFQVQGKALVPGAEEQVHVGAHGLRLGSEAGPETGSKRVAEIPAVQGSPSEGSVSGVATVPKASDRESSVKLDTRLTGRAGTDATQMMPTFEAALRTSGAREPQSVSLASASARPDETVLQLADRFKVQLSSDGSEIRVQLKPESLGQVEIRAEKGPDGVIARIVTESASVREYLEGRIVALETALQHQGLRVDRIEVSVQNGSQSQTGLLGSGPGHGGQRGGEAHGSSSDSWSVRKGPAENVTDPSATERIGPNSTFHAVA